MRGIFTLTSFGPRWLRGHGLRRGLRIEGGGLAAEDVELEEAVAYLLAEGLVAVGGEVYEVFADEAAVDEVHAVFGVVVDEIGVGMGVAEFYIGIGAGAGAFV